ncbi:MAG: hypothetical protein ACP6IY_15470 [Promethearchaeia archaeon]
MRNGKGLAFFALIIGLGGIAIGAYAAFFVPTNTLEQASEQTSKQIEEENVITNIWTVVQETTYYPGSSYTEVPDMDKTITVEKGETVLIRFSGQFSTTASTWLTGGVRIMLDNVEIDGSRREFNVETSTGLTAYAIETSVIIENLSEGEYEIELQATAQAGAGTDSLQDGILIIYTYK